MEVINHLTNFKVEIKEIEGIGNAVFSECELGIWHDIARDYVLSEGNVFLLVENNRIVSITEDPTTICPYEFSSIFEVKENELKVGDFVYYNEETLIKIESPEYPIFNIYDGEKWTTSLTLEEQLEFYRNRMSQLYREIKEQREEIEFLGFGEVDQKLYDELDRLKQKHMEISQDIAILENEKYK